MQIAELGDVRAHPYMTKLSPRGRKNAYQIAHVTHDVTRKSNPSHRIQAPEALSTVKKLRCVHRREVARDRKELLQSDTSKSISEEVATTW